MRFYRKDGTLNVKSKNLVWANPLMPTNAIEMRIRTVFLIYSSTYIFCFGIFAAGHYLGAKTRGHLCAGSGGTNPCQVPESEVCVTRVWDFASAFIFSVETMTTIGYGARAPTGNCFETELIIFVQGIVSLSLSTILIALLIARFLHHRPVDQQYFYFSPQVEIRNINGRTFLVVGLAGNQLRQIRLRAELLALKRRENEIFNSTKIAFKVQNSDENLIVMNWPLLMCHEVTEASPLHGKPLPEWLQAGGSELVIWASGEAARGMVSGRTSFVTDEFAAEGSLKLHNVKRTEENGRVRITWDPNTVWG